MLKGLIEDAFGEVLETGQTSQQQLKQITPTQIIKSALDQVGGTTSLPEKSELPPGLEDLKDKKVPPEQLQRMKQGDGQKTNQDLTKTRLDLERAKREKILRYREIQQKVLNVSKTKEQEEMRKEQEDMQEAQRKQQEEMEKQQVVTPKSGSNVPGIPGLGKKKTHTKLDIFSQQKQGTGEIRTAKLG